MDEIENTTSITSLSFYSKKLEKEKYKNQTKKPKASKKKKIIKVIIKANEIGNRKTRKINETKNVDSWKRWIKFANLWQKRREMTQITNIRDEIWEITINPAAVKKIIRQHCEQLYIPRCNNLQELNQFLKVMNYPKHKQMK